MTSLFDAGDMQRLDREATLTEQLPRQPIEDDRTPNEDPIRDEPSGDFDLILDSLLSALKRRLQ